MANKIKYGIKNAYYAKKTANGTYDTPVRLPGAVSLSLDPQGDISVFHADNIQYFKSATNNGYEGDLELALIPETFYTDILGDTQETGGVLLENADAISTEFAFGVQFEGDARATRFWFYNCVATRPTVEGETKESSIDPKTETLTISAAPGEDGIVRARTTSETTDAVYNAWFSAVYAPSAGE